MRILFLIDGLGSGGMQRRFVQLVKGLNEAGYTDLYLINTRDIVGYTEIFDYSINYEFMDRKKLGFAFKFVFRVREINPDIIQPWIDISAAWANIAYYFCKKKPIYIGAFIADCNYFKHALWSKIVMRWAYFLSSQVVSNSIAGLINYRVPKDKWKCIYNGFDFSRLNLYKDHSIRKEYDINKKYVVSMVARFMDNKDYPLFIKSALSILKVRDDVAFLCVGGGPNLESCKALIPREYKNLLIFTGPRDDVEVVFRESNLSVLCTNVVCHGEGVSNSILESMAFGTPVIATMGGGTAEIIVDGNTGVIYRPEDADKLPSIICNLLDDVEKRKTMGYESIRRIKAVFSLDVAVRQYIYMYEVLMSNR